MKLISIFSCFIAFSAFAQVEPSGPIPQKCQASREFNATVGNRQVIWSDLDRNTCLYNSASYSSPDEKFHKLCQEEVVKKGFDGAGILKCSGNRPWPQAPSVNCSGPDDVFAWTQIWYVTYQLSSSDFSIAKCSALNYCLEEILTDNKERKVAQEWLVKLNCK